MDIDTIAEEMEDIFGEEVNDFGPNDLAVGVGQAAEAEIVLDADSIDEEAENEARRRVIAGLAISVVGYAVTHDIDLAEAVETELEETKEQIEQKQAISDALEGGDAAELADALGEDVAEIPTGDEIDEDERGVY